MIIDSNSNYIVTDQASKLYNLVISKKVSKNEKLVVSVWCKVSNDFNGTRAGIILGNAINGFVFSNYNFSNRDLWQYLELESKSIGKNKFLLYVANDTSIIKEKIKGEVQFVYPQYSIKKR